MARVIQGDWSCRHAFMRMMTYIDLIHTLSLSLSYIYICVCVCLYIYIYINKFE